MSPPRKIRLTEEEDARDPLSLALGVRIRTLRQERGRSLEDVADAALLSSRYLWRVEDGRQNLSLRNIGRIAWALAVPLSELFEGVPNYEGPLPNKTAKA